MYRFAFLIAAVLAIAFGAAAALGIQRGTADAGSTLGGPVILGGDDLTDHGGVDGSGNPVEGWLYMQRALENIAPKVTRPGNDGSIAALGSADGAGGAGEAIAEAAEAVGLSVTYYDGETAINQFFADLASGSADPAILWIAGDGAGNDLGSGPGDEAAALVANATAISNFVNSGGGLFSHGSEYGWLSALLPTVTTHCCGSSDDLYFTPDGSAELAPLTLSDINAGPWHNHFEGDFGGLKVLVRSSSVQDESGQDVAVVIGGAQVTIEENPEEPEPTPDDHCIPSIPTHSCGGEPGRGVSDTPVASPTVAVPTAEPTVDVAPATQVPSQPSPVSTVAGVVRAPDTGDGSSGGAPMSAWVLAIAAAVALAGGGLTLTALRRT